jgi:hypothetical protein
MLSAPGAPRAATPLLDRVDGHAAQIGDLAIDQALRRQAEGACYGFWEVHTESVLTVTDSFATLRCRKRDSNPHALSSRRF